MYKKFTIICIIFLTILLLSSFIKNPTSKDLFTQKRHNFVYSSGIYGQSVAGCTCHGGTATGSVSVNITGLPTSPIIGTTYILTFNITGGNPFAGYNIAVDNGSFGIISGNSESQTIGNEITHTSPKALVSGATSFNFEWTPSTAGNANFTYVANNIDGTGGTGGDFWNNGNKTVPVQTLPVILQKFTGSGLNNAANALQWQVSEETNFLQYEIEKSNDGTNFRKIGTQLPLRNNTLKQYYFIDENIAITIAKNFYRLKIVDINNTFTYSPIVAITTKQKIAKSIVFPNVVNSSQSVTIYSGKNNLKEILLITANGSILEKIKTEKNTYNMQLPNNLQIGNYFIKLIYKDNTTNNLTFLVQ